jgi:hypothetical protein
MRASSRITRPPLEKDPAIERRVDRLGARGASLHGII